MQTIFICKVVKLRGKDISFIEEKEVGLVIEVEAALGMCVVVVGTESGGN